MAIVQHWDDIEPESRGPKVSKRTVTGLGASLVRIELQAGAQADRHSHAFEQFVQVISGSGSLETAEGVQRFTAGTLFYFPPGTWHAAYFDEDTVLVETNLVA